jgi:hypothetical protein
MENALDDAGGYLDAENYARGRKAAALVETAVLIGLWRWLRGLKEPVPKTIHVKVGNSTATVTVSGGTATVVTDYVHTLTDRSFFNAITQAARSQGATRLVVETGAVHDMNLAIKLGQAAQSGRTIAGGKVTVTSKPGTTQPSFRIEWESIPEVTP